MFKPKNLLWPILLLVLGFIGWRMLSEHSSINTFDYTGLNQSLERSITALEQRKAYLLGNIKKSLSKREIDSTAYNKVLKTKTESEKILSNLQTTQAAYLSAIQTKTSDYNLKHKLETDLQQGIDSYFNFLLSQLTYTSERLKENSLLNNSKFSFSTIDKINIINSLFLSYKIQVLHTEVTALNLVYIEHMAITEDFYEIQAIAIPQTNFIVEGGNAVVNIALAALLKVGTPEIQSNGVRIIESEYGLAVVEKKCKDIGIHIEKGTITNQTTFGLITRPWSFQYVVITPGASLSLNKINRLYKSIPNPVKISVPGYDDDKLYLRSQDAIIEKTGTGCYNVIPSKNTKFQYLFVDAINQKGEKSTVAGLKAIVSDLPTPKASITNITDGAISYDQFLSEPVLNIIAADSDIDPQHYSLTSYEFTVFKNVKEVTEPIFATSKNLKDNNAIHESIKNLYAGDKVLISDIHCTDASGNDIEVPSISFRIK